MEIINEVVDGLRSVNMNVYTTDPSREYIKLDMMYMMFNVLIGSMLYMVHIQKEMLV